MNPQRLRRAKCVAAAILLASATIALSGCGEPPPDPDEILKSGEKLYSQFNEELIIRHFFKDRTDGFFVDVGAYDWKEASTTYYLEAHLGWSGISIDALEDFRAGYEKNRPKTRFFSYIVTDHSGTVETLFAAGPLSSVNETHVTDMRATAQDEKLVDEMLDPDELSEAHMAEMRQVVDTLSKLPDIETKGVEVKTITLNELLDENGVTSIDFLSMDIEGGEPKALAGFDIDRFKPELVGIEVAPQLRDVIGKYFADHGYERIQAYARYDAVNWYFRPRP